MMVTQLLDENPDPTDDQIRHYLTGNLCRCAAYPEVIDAVKLAAKKRKAGAQPDRRRNADHRQRGNAMSDVAIGSQPWYRSLNRSQWNTLIASNLGWLFDGYETYALIISVGVALRQLLDPSQFPQIPFYAGTVIAITLLGWGIGGLIGGVVADYIGRKRTMLLAILAYSIMTGLSAFAWDWWSFVILRFLVGVAIGSEWVTGASIVAELWPDKNRGKGVGLMQTGFGIGILSGLGGVVLRFPGRSGRLARHVPARCRAGPADIVDPPIHPGIR